MPTSWKFYTSTKESWDAIMEDCLQAQTSIKISQYTFNDDSIGREFLDIFEGKAKQGLDVRILADAYASFPLFRSTHVLRLIKHGVKIKPYHPFSFRTTSTIFRRNHSKLALIDDSIAHIGGVGIKNKLRFFRDTNLRIKNELVLEMSEVFDRIWENPFDSIEKEVSLNKDLDFLINNPGNGQKQITEWLTMAITEAQDYIYLTTAYFFPDHVFYNLLLDKAMEGVDVRIILRGKTDETLTDFFSSAFFHKGLKAGARFYRYTAHTLHAKTAIIDGKWSTVGSANLDKFTFYHNLEMNVVGNNPLFAALLKKHFLEDLLCCQEVKLKEWDNRPFMDKAGEFIAWPMHYLL